MSKESLGETTSEKKEYSVPNFYDTKITFWGENHGEKAQKFIDELEKAHKLDLENAKRTMPGLTLTFYNFYPRADRNGIKTEVYIRSLDETGVKTDAEAPALFEAIKRAKENSSEDEIQIEYDPEEEIGEPERRE